MRFPLALRGLPSWTAALAPAAGAVVVVFWRVLVAGEVFGARDHALFHWPLKALFVSLVRNSPGLPLWNPFLAAGQPFAANPQHAVFHPLSALFLAVPLETAYRLHILVLVLATVVSGFFLARSLRLPMAVAAFSAVAWGFGGATMSALHLVPTLLTSAPLPALLGVAFRLGHRRVRTDVLVFGFLLGMMVLGGDAPVLLMGLLLAVFAVLHGTRLQDSVEAPPIPLARALGRLLLGGMLGSAIGAATLVPGLS
ncbi:MAG TPA: hypothetical protein VE129_09680 [Thermoanaerobaculia bacterium]|nr:hypothetical protein [Thermoanaerobaculia bacterium]